MIIGDFSMDILWWVFGLLFFVTMLAVSIGLHEVGHYSVARLFKIDVPKFFVGFGPTLFSRKGKNTEFGVKAIPLGGFVSIEDTRYPEESTERTMLNHVEPYKRILIFLGGPVVNLILGFVILTTVFTIVPGNNITNEIKSLIPCSDTVKSCAAVSSGLAVGDKIVSIDGVENIDFNGTAGHFKPTGSTVVVDRNGELLTLEVKSNPDGKMGMYMVNEPKNRTVVESVNLVGTYMKMSLKAVVEIPEKMPNVLKSIVGTEERSQETVSSIVGAGRIYGEVASSDNTFGLKFSELVYYTGMLNFALGVINLLPLMPLDGGRIAIAIIDSFKWNYAKLRRREYKPFDEKYVYAITAATGSLVVFFMFVVILADIVSPIPLG